MAENTNIEKAKRKEAFKEFVDDHPILAGVCGVGALSVISGAITAVIHMPQNIITAIRRPKDSFYDAEQLRAIHGMDEPDTYVTNNKYVTNKEPDIVLFKKDDDKK